MECPELKAPANGTVRVEGLTYPSEAHYSCNSGYELDGVAKRTCLIRGAWTERAPTCIEETGSAGNPNVRCVDYIVL